MLKNEFKEWPEVRTPNGTHGVQAPKVYVFPLTDEVRSADEETSRGLSIGSLDGTVAKNQPKGFAYRHRRELVGVAAIAVVAAVVAGLALGVRRHIDSQEVLSSCQQSVDIYQSNTERLKKAVDGAAEDLRIEKSQVQDEKTVTALHAAVSKGQEKVKLGVSCDASASVEDNQFSDEKITEATRSLGNKVEAILSAKTAVERSKKARDVAVAKADLVNKVNDGQNVLANVHSSDLNMRQNLSAALNDAQQMATTSNSSDPNVYTNQLNKLQEAMDKYSATATAQ